MASTSRHNTGASGATPTSVAFTIAVKQRHFTTALTKAQLSRISTLKTLPSHLLAVFLNEVVTPLDPANLEIVWDPPGRQYPQDETLNIYKTKYTTPMTPLYSSIKGNCVTVYAIGGGKPGQVNFDSWYNSIYLSLKKLNSDHQWKILWLARVFDGKDAVIGTKFRVRDEMKK